MEKKLSDKAYTLYELISKIEDEYKQYKIAADGSISGKTEPLLNYFTLSFIPVVLKDGTGSVIPVLEVKGRPVKTFKLTDFGSKVN
jgi:hypothetical protein